MQFAPEAQRTVRYAQARPASEAEADVDVPQTPSVVERCRVADRTLRDQFAWVWEVSVIARSHGATNSNPDAGRCVRKPSAEAIGLRDDMNA